MITVVLSLEYDIENVILNYGYETYKKLIVIILMAYQPA